MTGYVLTVENITRSIEEEERRDQALHTLSQGSRSAIGNIRAAVANLLDYPDMEPELRERFLRVIDDEVARRSQVIDQTMSESSSHLKRAGRWKTSWGRHHCRGAAPHQRQAEAADQDRDGR